MQLANHCTVVKVSSCFSWWLPAVCLLDYRCDVEVSLWCSEACHHQARHKMLFHRHLISIDHYLFCKAAMVIVLCTPGINVLADQIANWFHLCARIREGGNVRNVYHLYRIADAKSTGGMVKELIKEEQFFSPGTGVLLDFHLSISNTNICFDTCQCKII